MATSAGTTKLQALLDQAGKGRSEAYDELLGLAAERLQRLTRKMLRNYPHLRRWEQTDDVFQNAVIRLHRSLSEVQPDSVRRFFGLATTQIRRTLIDLARHHFGPEGQGAKHHSNAGATSSHGGILQNKCDPAEQPETLAAWAAFHEAVDALPADEREVFQLAWYADLPQQEIADLLGISVSTVQRRWYGARHLLRQTLSDQYPSTTG